MVTDKIEIISMHFFTDIGPSLACKIRNDSDKHFNYSVKRNSTITFKYTKIYEDTIIKITDCFPLKTSSGVDQISLKQLKYTKLGLIKSVTLITKQTVNTGIFPDKLKITKVIPIFKSGEESLFTNYRPISLLPVISKIIKKFIHNQLYIHFKQQTILYNSQYGFRTEHSTELAALEQNNNCFI